MLLAFRPHVVDHFPAYKLPPPVRLSPSNTTLTHYIYIPSLFPRVKIRIKMSAFNALTILVLLPHLLGMYNTVREVMDTRARLLEARLEAARRRRTARVHHE